MGSVTERLLQGLLHMAVILPALAFWWSRGDDGGSFVLYREPKLVAAGVFGWLFVAVWLWSRRTQIRRAELITILERPAMLAFGAFLSYLTLTGLWVVVVANYAYELNQYLLITTLLIVLFLWARQDAQVVSRVRGGLILSIAMVTAVGFVQMVTPIAFLTPIDVGIGISHPSLMGYKNPAALAVLGQIFLLAGLVVDESRSIRARVAWGLLLVAELGYLASLHSRTSWSALVIATLALAVLFLLRPGDRRRKIRLVCEVALVMAFLVGTYVNVRSFVNPRGADPGFGTDAMAAGPIVDAEPLLSLVARPGSYLGSDRGTYLLNTVNMARHNPFGVGLGDWQTHYPVYRLHNRDIAFSDLYQVRRAHSDHVQFLGEAGWPGLALWLLFLGVLVFGSARRYLASGDPARLFVAAQLVAFAVAMATDYLLELPYNKLQFFLVVFLALAEPAATPQRPAPRVRGATAVAVLVTILALLQVAYHVALARKIHLAATMEQSYVSSLDPPRKSSWSRIVEQGRELAAMPGHTKTLHKTYLLLGHSAELLGHRDLARDATRQALALHPYYPNALRLMAKLADDAAEARRWQAAYVKVMRQATHGFDD